MQSRPHRRSFRATTGVATISAVVLLVALGAIVVAFRRSGGAASLLWIALGVVVLGADSIAAMVAVGGVAVLHRDQCEELGLPYVPTRPRERVAGPVTSRVRRALRRYGRPRPGDLMEVRSLPEILATLDDQGCLDGLPFMPEMAQFCGHRFPVFRRVDKLWEYAHGTGMRRLRSAVLLKTVHCDGLGHGGCQSGCHLIWKEAWLKWPGQEAAHHPTTVGGLDLRAHAQRTTPEGIRFVCQATQYREATTQLGFNSLSHYGRDLVGGNLRLGTIVVEIAVRGFNEVQKRLKRPCWPVLQPLDSDSSPHQDLHLRPGQLVRVRSKREIESTLNRQFKNRGLSLSGDLLAYSGGSYRVAASITKVIHEGTGELLSLKYPSILLEDVHALGGPLLIPQNEYFFWREIWLEPLDDGRPVANET